MNFNRLFNKLNDVTSKAFGESVTIITGSTEVEVNGIFTKEILIVTDIQAEYLTCEIVNNNIEINKTTTLSRGSSSYSIITYTISSDNNLIKLILRES